MQNVVAARDNPFFFILCEKYDISLNNPLNKNNFVAFVYTKKTFIQYPWLS